MHDFCFHHLAWHPQRYPQNVWLPSDVPGFDGGFGTPVGLFLWRVLIRSENRDGVVDMYMGVRNLHPPFSVRRLIDAVRGLITTDATDIEIHTATVPDAVRPRLRFQRHSWLQTGVLHRQPNQAQSDDGEDNFHEMVRCMNNLRFTSSHGNSFVMVQGDAWYGGTHGTHR